jgi:hypothetical protein
VRVLFDQGTPVPLRAHLPEHAVETAYERGWSTLKNGELLAVAQSAGFEVFVTTDKRLRYQQNLAGRSLAIVLLPTTSWPRLQRQLQSIANAVNGAKPGSYFELPPE